MINGNKLLLNKIQTETGQKMVRRKLSHRFLERSIKSPSAHCWHRRPFSDGGTRHETQRSACGIERGAGPGISTAELRQAAATPSRKQILTPKIRRIVTARRTAIRAVRQRGRAHWG